MSEPKRIPQHVAIIMDGNGRWAGLHGKERYEGHAAGVEPVRASLRAAVRWGVKYLTLYAFSTENWGPSRSRSRRPDGALLPQRRKRNARAQAAGSAHRHDRRPEPFFGQGPPLPRRGRTRNGRRRAADADSGAQLLVAQRDHPGRAASCREAAEGVCRQTRSPSRPSPEPSTRRPTPTPTSSYAPAASSG